MKFKFPAYADYWFVAFSLLVVICVSSYGTSCAGYKTGPTVFSYFGAKYEYMTPEINTDTDAIIIPKITPTAGTTSSNPVTAGTSPSTAASNPTGYVKPAGYSIV